MMSRGVSMKEAKDEIYYHINTGKKLKVGDTLTIGDDYNPFYYEIYNMEHLENGKDANEYLMEMKRKNNLVLTESLAKLVYQTIHDDAMITRELMFEEVRKERDSSLPSRLKCLYVCKTKKELETWINIFQRTNKKDIQIVKLNLTGTIFKGDASFVLRQNISLNKKKEQARKYWNGERKDNINEHLFIGTAVVEDVLNNIDV